MKLTLKNYGEDISDAVEGFFDTVEWDTVGKTLSTGVEGALDTMLTFIKDFDGSKVTKAFKDLFGNINWGEISSKLFELLVRAALLTNPLVQFAAIGQRIFQGILQGIFDAIINTKESIEKNGGNIGEGLLEGIKRVFTNIRDWFVKHVYEPFMDTVRFVFGIHSPSKVMEEQGQYIMEGFLNGIGEKINAVKEAFGKIKDVIVKVLGEAWLKVVEGAQGAINFFIEGFNKVIGMLNNISVDLPKWLGGGHIGFEIDEIDKVNWVDDYKKKWEEAEETTKEATEGISQAVSSNLGEAEKSVKSYSDSTTKNLGETNAYVEAAGKTAFGKYVLGIKSQQPSIQTAVEKISGDIKTNLAIFDMSETWGKLLTGNYAKGVGSEQANLKTVLEKVATDIKDKLNISNVTETWGKLLSSKYVKGIGSEQTNLKTVVQKITTDIKDKLNISNTTETWGRNLVSQYSKGIENQKKVLNNAVNVIKDAVKGSLDRGDLSKGWGMNLIDKFKDGINKQNQSKALLSSFQSVINNARNYLDAGRTAYTWGEDMMKGFINGINALKNRIARTAESVAKSISSFLHFSKPDVGPLRDYETWMPDMIKGLSDTLIKASPILDNTVAGITTRIADSFNNLSMPEINENVSLNQPSNQLIGNIANKLNRTSTDENTNNMIRATYEAVSRALLDNNGTNDRQPIIVNVGNREVYRGYGQYKDEQSNMLGVTV